MSDPKVSCRAFQAQGQIVDKCGTCFRGRADHRNSPQRQYQSATSTVSKMSMSAIDDRSQRTGTVVTTTSTRYQAKQCVSYQGQRQSPTELRRSPFFDDHDFATRSERRIVSTWRDDSAIGKSLTSHSYSRNVKYGQGTPPAIDGKGDIAGFRVRFDQLLDDDEFDIDPDVQFQGDSSVYSTYEDLSCLPIDKDNRSTSLPEERQANLELKCSLVESANVNKSLDSLVIQKEAEQSQESEQERVRSRSLGAKEGLHTVTNGNTSVANEKAGCTSVTTSPAVGTSSEAMAEKGAKIKKAGAAVNAADSDPAADNSVDQQNAKPRQQSKQTSGTSTGAAKEQSAEKATPKNATTNKEASATQVKSVPAGAGVSSADSVSPKAVQSAADKAGNEPVERINTAEVEQLKSRVTTLQSRIDEMEKDADLLMEENKELKASQLPDSIRNQDPQKAIIELKKRLDASETECNALKEANAALQSELEEIQIEMDEVRDTFREGEIEEFREIQKQLDAAAKNCRVLQYRLRKADKRIDDLESEKKSFAEKLSSQSGAKLPNGNGSGAMNDMQQELKVAKDVSVRLHLELESMEEKRGRIEEENQLLRRKLVDSEKQRKEMKREIEKVRIEVELLKRKLGQIQDDALNEEQRRKMQKLQESSDGSVEYDVAALMAELHQKTERECDLQHQLQLVEEEANVMRRKLGEIEQERERLEFELEKYKMHFGTLESPRKESEKGKISEKEAELRLQLMMTEQEATVMHRKISELETKNEELMSAIVKSEGKDGQPGGTKGEASDELRHYMEENENLKQHLDDAENEIHHLVAKLDKYEELSTLGIITVGDPDETIDLKKFIRLKEEENLAIRKRLVEAEVINRIVEDEVRTYKKLNEDALGHGSTKGKGKGAEAKLKSQISLLKQENDRMRKRMVDCEIQNETLLEEIQQYRSKDGGDRAPPSSQEHAPESDKLPELQGKVNHLEEQLGDLMSIVKGKEQIQEQQEEELKHAHRTFEMASNEAKVKQERLEKQLSLAVEKQETLMKQLENVESYSKLQSELEQTCADDDAKPGSFIKGLYEKVKVLEQQLEEEKKKTKAVEKKLELLSETASDTLSVCSDDGSHREREKELLRFELNESQSMMAEANDQIRSLQEELAKERESREKERQGYERRIAEIGDEKEKIQRTIEMEKDNAEHQRKMETKAWRKEKTELYQQLEDFKKRTDELHRKLQTEQSNWSKEDFNNKGAKSGDTTPTSPDWISEKAELERVRQKLQAETQKLENDSSKHRAKNEELRAKIEVMTAENEELKASRDILMEERSLLHSKLTESQQEKSEMEVTLKKERSSWEKERATARFDFENERKRRENELKKAKDENDRLRREKAQSDFGHKHYEAKLKEFERKALELNELLKKKEEAFARDKAAIADDYAKKLQSEKSRLEKETADLKCRQKTREEEMQTTVNDLQSKVDKHESENAQLNSKFKDSDLQKQDLQRKVQDLETKLAQAQTTGSRTAQAATSAADLESSKGETETQNREKKPQQTKTSANEGEWKREKEQLKEAMEKLKSSLKAREDAWGTERNELCKQRKAAEDALKQKEVKWTAENSTLTNDLQRLKKELREREESWERARKDLQNSLNEKTTSGELSSAKENELKAEVEQLHEQLKLRTEELTEAQGRTRVAEDALAERENAWKKEKTRLLQQSDSKDKLHKGAISALQFRLDAEARSGKEVKGRLESRVRNEMKEKERQKQINSDMQSELATVKAQFDNERKAWEREKSHLQRQAAEAKETKRMVLDLRRSAETLQQKLAVEEKRRSQTQNTYVAEKSAWEIERSEMQVKIARLEQHTKGSSKKSKEKAEEQVARLKDSWERERNEHKRLLAASHGKNMDLQRQLESMERTLQNERRDFETKLNSERKDWQDEKTQLVARIKEVEEENRVLKEWETKTKEAQKRHQRDHDAWKEEREEYQKKLSENEKIHTQEKSRMDEIIAEFEKLKNIATALEQVDTSIALKHSQNGSIRETPQRDTEKPLTKTQSSAAMATNKQRPESETITSDQVISPQISHFEQVQVATTLIPTNAAHAHRYLTGDDGIAWNAGEDDTDLEVETTLSEAMREIEKATDELAQYQAELSLKDINMNLRRSRSHSDVFTPVEEMRKAKKPLYQSASLTRTTTPSTARPGTRDRPTALAAQTPPEHEDSKSVIGKPSSLPIADQCEQSYPSVSSGPGSPGTVISEKLAQTSISHSTKVPTATSSIASDDVPPPSTQEQEEGSPSDDKGRTSPPSKIVTVPVVGRSGYFDVRGLLRPTEKKQPLLPWMQDDGKLINDSQRDPEVVRESRVLSAKKMFENGSSRSREASPAPGRITSPMSEKPKVETTKPTATSIGQDPVKGISPKAESAGTKTPTSPVGSSSVISSKAEKEVEEKAPSPRTKPSSDRQASSPSAKHGKPPVPGKPDSAKKSADKTSPKQQGAAERKGPSSPTYARTPPNALYVKRMQEPSFERDASTPERDLTKKGPSPNASRTPTPPIRDAQFVPEKLSPEPFVPIIPGNLPRTKTRMQHQEAVRLHHTPPQQQSPSQLPADQQRKHSKDNTPSSPRTARAKFFAESPSESTSKPDKFDRSLRSRSLSPPGFRLSGEPLKFSLPPAVPQSVTKDQKTVEEKTSVRDRSPSPSGVQSHASTSSGQQPKTKSSQQPRTEGQRQKHAPSNRPITATASPTTAHGKSATSYSQASPKMGVRSMHTPDQSANRKAAAEDKQKASKTTKKSSVFKSGGNSRSGNAGSPSDNAFSQITADIVPMLTMRFPRPPKPANRRAPSRWLHRRLQQQTLHIDIVSGQIFVQESHLSPDIEQHPSMQEALEMFKRFCETTV
ncbi:uncharacterized protein [Ptychodera flava]|uniref:uncharacterized protein isoform X4 n=1 Tax=Ptychodera flava TaxID=63121 RepID=UPI00396A2BDF